MSDPESPILEVHDLRKTFQARRLRHGGEVHAVEDVSFSLARGGSLGILGESGSGKTTIARMLMGLEQPTSGRILLEGVELTRLTSRHDRLRRARLIQMVFQDPYTSLDPRQHVGAGLDEIQRVHFNRTPQERAQRTAELLEAVGLGERHARSVPRNLSGGQRQRVAIARALATEPAVLVLDEAVSALDVSIQAQILNLLADLRRHLGLSYIMISHDLAVIRQVSDECLVMHQGRVVEGGHVAEILARPKDAYTRRLIDSVPRADMVLPPPAGLDASEGAVSAR